MRRTLGTSLALTLLSVLLLAGCGTESEVSGNDPAPTSTPTPSPEATPASGAPETPTASPTSAPSSPQTDGDAAEPVAYDLVALIGANGSRATASPMLTPIDDPDQLDAFVSQLGSEGAGDQVRAEATSASYDGALWGGVLSGGCDVPPGVFVEEGEAGYLVTPQKVAEPRQECVVAVTTIVLVAIR